MELRVHSHLLCKVERLKQPGREARVAADRAELVVVQPPVLRKRCDVDRHLAEIMKPCGTYQAPRFPLRKAEGAREPRNVFGDALGVLLRVQIALVDDRSEGIQRGRRLDLEPLVARLRLVDRGEERHEERQYHPALTCVAEGEHDAQAALAEALTEGVAEVV